MLLGVLFQNSFFCFQNLHNWSSFKFKVKNLYTSPKMTQNSCLNVKNIKKPNNSKNLDKNNKYSIEKLAFFSSLFFLFIFSSNPNFTKIFNFSGALASKFSKKNLVQKLSQVPVFAVTNATGQPYLANNSNGEQVGLIFFSQEDALAMLKSMQKTHQALEARIYIMGLDKAYRMVLSNASPSGIRGNLGQELKMIFRFYPDQKQVKNANALKKSLNPIESFKGIPVFIADGLTIRKGREEIVPVFLNKEDLEKSWNSMCKYNPDQPLKPSIQVGNLLELISKMETEPKEFESFGFFPPSESVDFVKRENSTNPSARIMPGIFQKI